MEIKNKQSKARLYDVMKDVELLIKLSKEESNWRLGLNINSKLREIAGDLE